MATPEMISLALNVDVYSCGQMASSCTACASVNATYSCGWCAVAQACTTYAHCPGASWVGPGSSCDAEEQQKIEDESVGEPELSDEGLLGLGEPLHHLGEEAKSDLGTATSRSDCINPFHTGTHFYLEICVRLDYFIDIRKVYGGQKINGLSLHYSNPHISI
ncbi:hypothetical protein E2C01_006830 [Portunus trituberculatus]|uniref:PSI domain-containing protein n=1 Tax=Portunus trituberculatus TaxID=210409 RepID=A0A5B7CXU2_PORTR|nr:hypothetical protein [Portunus trituberculatus]